MFIYLLLLMNTAYHIGWCQYDLSNVIPGTKMSINDDMFVSASNAFSNFAVIMHPFRNTSDGGPIRCNMRYYTSDRFVHSVAVVGISKNTTNAEEFIFVFAAEKISTMTPYVCTGFIHKANCTSRSLCTDIINGSAHQEYYLIGVDINGAYAYGFSSSFVFKLDIYENRIILNTTTDAVWPSAGFIPRALDVADTWAVVAGYGYSDEVKKNYAALGCYINLSTIINASCVSLVSETTFLIPSNVISYNELYELSVAIRGQKILVGIHRLSTVVVLRNIASSLNVTRTHTLIYSDATSFGRVVDWADDTFIAILVQNPYETSWSKSQVFVYDENSVTLTSPVFTFPNNQQIVGSRLSRPSFARFGITIKRNMAILTTNADILIIPVAGAGYVSRWIDTNERVFVFYYEPRSCIGGTYKNRSSLGPCQICPPNTRNPGTLSTPALQCFPCSNTSINSFCPLASLVDIDINTFPSFSQAVAYPETADATNIEDILINNVFQIGAKGHCLMISPLFWTFVVGGLSLVILVLMMIIKLCGCQRCLKCRTTTKSIFKHTDMIGEGELWMGGLATFALIVLLSFSYWFSASFIQRYPIENISEPATFACNKNLMNAQFSTGLELLDIPKSEDSQPIFDLLDDQIFNLTVELINTGFACNSTTVQENLIGTKYIPLSFACPQSIATAVTSITFRLPSHQSTVQINMTGPYWIGAIRLCIRGQGQINGSNTLRTLDFCELYSSSNEAIGRVTNIPIVFVKNINMTQSLAVDDPTLYSGIWMPTFPVVPLSDEAYYSEFGNYLRYTSSLTILQVILDERPFYIKNIQRPIVHESELIFHDLLFTTLCIELFGLSFLIIRLIIVPLCRSIVYLWKRCFNRNEKSDDLHTSTNTNRSNYEDSNSNIENNRLKIVESDFSIVNHNQQIQSIKLSTSEVSLYTLQTKTRL